MDVVSACQTPPMMTYMGAPTVDCSAASTTGANWETWCDAAGLTYLWVEFTGAAAVSSSASQSCTAYNNPEATIQASGGFGGQYGGVMPKGSWFITATPSTLVSDYDVSVDGTAGSGNLWLSGELECGPNPNTNMNVTLLGFTFKWQIGP